MKDAARSKVDHFDFGIVHEDCSRYGVVRVSMYFGSVKFQDLVVVSGVRGRSYMAIGKI